MFEIDGGMVPQDQRIVYDIFKSHYEDLMRSPDHRLSRVEAATHDDTVLLMDIFIGEAQFPETHVGLLSRVALDDACSFARFDQIEPGDFR